MVFGKNDLPDGLRMLDGYYNFLSDLSRVFLIIVSKNFKSRRI
jgi:hypothetical protein